MQRLCLGTDESVCYGADGMVGNAPHVRKCPTQSPHAVEAKQRIIYYINKDNKYICTPIHPTPVITGQSS